MKHTIDSLRDNASLLESRIMPLSTSYLIQHIEDDLRAILSYQNIESQFIPQLEDTLSLLYRNLNNSYASDFEKQRVFILIRRVQKKLEVTIYNPYNCKFSIYTREKLLSLKQYGYIGNITVTSAGRSVEDQARIMYDNIIKNGKQHQLDTYKQPGKNVINTYNPKLSREENIANMANAIRKEGPDRVSKHVADFSKINVLDVDKKSLSNIQVFIDSVTKAGFTKVLDENGCIHIELPQK